MCYVRSTISDTIRSSLTVSRLTSVERPVVGGPEVILIFRPQTVRSGTRHVQYDIEQGSGPGFHTESVYSHLRVLHSRQNVDLAIFGLFGLGILLV